MSLGGLEVCKKSGETLQELVALCWQWKRWLAGRVRAEVLTKFIEGGTKAGSTGESPEATHRVVALFDGAMVLLKAIVQITVRAVLDLAAYGAPDSLWISIMTVSRHALWLMPDRLDRLCEKCLGSSQIAGLTQHRFRVLSGVLALAMWTVHQV
jgi:hypothetical protein